ncbi:MAG: PilX N-terminal domain-containing pilus assembly protein [Gammaproteobacteria bacterium]|nr:PilX N-terminal domain-containing pilus assembly protein [Gammaproteobacteria bacterium]
MTKQLTKHYKHQRGAAVLLVSVVLLIAVTLLVMFAVRVGLLDQRMSGNEYRHKEAFANAEAGLEQAASYLRANPVLHAGDVADGWASCTGSTAIFPCNLTGAELVYATVVAGTSITPNLPMAGNTPNSSAYLVKTASTTIAVGEGASDDGTGSAVAQVSFAKTSLLTPGQIPPLMMPSGDLNGSFTIVPNPNGGGPGVPISAWVKSIGTSTGSWQTCNHGEFQDTGVCMDTKDDTVSWSTCTCIEPKSTSTSVGDDIVVDSTDFPFSPFAFIFGKDLSTAAEVDALKAEIKARADDKGKVLADCTTLDTIDLANDVEMPLIWVEGACDIGPGVVIGDRTTPIILVVEGDIKVNANGEIWGIMVGLADYTMNGGAVVHGSAVSEIESKLTNGAYAQVYDESVFARLQDDTLTTDISKVQYSWRDFTP